MGFFIGGKTFIITLNNVLYVHVREILLVVENWLGKVDSLLRAYMHSGVDLQVGTRDYQQQLYNNIDNSRFQINEPREINGARHKHHFPSDNRVDN